MKDINLFVFGMGYSAKVLASLVRQAGGMASGTSRHAASNEANDRTLLPFSQSRPLAEPEASLRGVTHLLSSIPADANGDPAWRSHASAIAKMPQLRWIGYLSTTGVYGDHGGGWVDEDTPATPGQDRSRHRVVAEQQWLELGRRMDVPAQIFRLPAIYGPRRSPLDQVRSGQARRIDRPGHFFSRIHVEDIAATLLASMQHPVSGAIYNVADDEPAPTADVVAYACTLLQVPVPDAISYDAAAAGMNEMARSFWSENRRVRNDRIKRDLGVSLRYPTYREGLRAILAAGG